MPCICYGAVSSDEEFDNFLKSDEGKAVMEFLKHAVLLIKNHKISEECTLRDIEFRQMFVKYLLNMLVECDENGKPKL